MGWKQTDTSRGIENEGQMFSMLKFNFFFKKDEITIQILVWKNVTAQSSSKKFKDAKRI